MKPENYEEMEKTWGNEFRCGYGWRASGCSTCTAWYIYNKTGEIPTEHFVQGTIREEMNQMFEAKE